MKSENLYLRYSRYAILSPAKKIARAVALAGFLLISLSALSNVPEDQLVFLKNSRLELGFDRNTGSLRIFNDLTNHYEFLDRDIDPGSPWAIDILSLSGTETIDSRRASRFDFKQEDSQKLILVWREFTGIQNKNFKVKVKVSLNKTLSSSIWQISAEGCENLKIQRVVFPSIATLKDPGNEFLAVPVWMGELIKNPRAQLAGISGRAKDYQWTYPGPLSMQCLALYNPEKCGFYAACNDSSAYRKSFVFSLDTLKTLTYQMISYPSIDSIYTAYTPAYQAIIGSFRGDWITAAVRYRQWGTKQRWCLESRFKKNRSPAWLQKTALWVWNRGRSSRVLVPAEKLNKRLNLPANVFWHWWHGCAYDEGFPEYFPPREGTNSFVQGLSEAHNKGLNAIVYMNVLQWGTSTASWKSENAAAGAVKDIRGNLNTHVYNVFTGKSLTSMCIGSQFWRDKYAALSDTALNRYQIDGIYMDQACLSRTCYDTHHGHPLGGGNYWVQNFKKLTARIREKTTPYNKPVLAGEGCGEVWLPYLDLFLALQVSMERYAGINGREPIPFFQAVYHPYGITYGNYSSLLIPPYDELWPNEFAPKNPEKLLDKDFNKQFLMEQARSFVWGMQPTIANYREFLDRERRKEIDYLIELAEVRYQGLKYLLYGEYVRSPQFKIPEEELNISRLSIYAGRKGKSITRFQKSVPLIYAGTWRSEDEQIAIALASIGDDPFPVDITMNADQYDLPSSGQLYLLDRTGKKLLTRYSERKIHIRFTLPARGICLLEIVPDRSSIP